LILLIAVAGCFCSSPAATADKNRRNGGQDRTEPKEGGSARESGAVRDKRGCFCLARNRRSDRAHVRALAEGRTHDEREVEKRGESHHCCDFKIFEQK